MKQPNPFVKGRPTIYKGTQMRSRLEAKFAAHLDAMKRRWGYEPVCFADEDGQYLPDFSVEVDGTMCYIEVKPTEALAQEWIDGPMRRIWSTDPDALLIATWHDNEAAEYGEDQWRLITAMKPIAWWEWALRLDAPIEYRDPEFVTLYNDDYTYPVGHTTRTVIHHFPKHTFDVLYRCQRERGGISLPAPLARPPAELRPVIDEWHYICADIIDDWMFPHFIGVDENGVLGDTYRGQSFTMGKLAWFVVELGYPSRMAARK